MSAHQAVFPVAAMARVLGVSQAGFHAWRRRPVSAHAVADAALLKRIRTIHAGSRESYGAPRVHAELRAGGEKHGRKRIARLMRAAGLIGASRRRATIVTTRRDKEARPAPDLVDRDFTAFRPNQLWVADLPYVRLQQEFVYVAVVLDAFSRRVIGWALNRSLRSTVAVEALRQALENRKPLPGLVHHSDRGVQYASHDYTEMLRNQGAICSMSRAGNPYDNARCESFLKTLKQEEIYCREYRDLDDLRHHIGAFIDDYYNPQRLHSALGYLSPEAFEAAATYDAGSAARMSFERHEEIYPNDLSL